MPSLSEASHPPMPTLMPTRPQLQPPRAVPWPQLPPRMVPRRPRPASGPAVAESEAVSGAAPDPPDEMWAVAL